MGPRGTCSQVKHRAVAFYSRNSPANKLGFGLLEGLPGLHSHDRTYVVLRRDHQVVPPARHHASSLTLKKPTTLSLIFSIKPWAGCHAINDFTQGPYVHSECHDTRGHADPELHSLVSFGQVCRRVLKLVMLARRAQHRHKALEPGMLASESSEVAYALLTHAA